MHPLPAERDVPDPTAERAALRLTILRICEKLGHESPAPAVDQMLEEAGRPLVLPPSVFLRLLQGERWEYSTSGEDPHARRLGEMKLDGAAAVVTGASRGIGRAVAEALAQQKMRVALVSRAVQELERAAAEIRAAGGESLAVTCDVTKPEAVANMVERVERELGPLEVLVANAGRFAAVGRSWELPAREWQLDLEANLLGTHFCCREVLRGMTARCQGYVIIMSSRAGTWAPHVHGSAYGASKLALAGYAETLAQEAAPFGIRVFAVDPGPVRTAMTEPLLSDSELAQWQPGFGQTVERGDDVSPSVAADLVFGLLTGAADRLSGRLLRAVEGFDAIVARTDEILARNLYTVRLRMPES